jgi:anti-sigma factor RsiW
MTHDEAALVAYLWGELDPAAVERVERHLVDCDRCWAAVQADSRGRAAAESLRELAPPVLRDRLRFAMDAEKGPTRRRTSRRFGRAAVALVVILTAGALIAGVSRVGRHRPPADPPSVAAVVRLAGVGASLEAALTSRVIAGGQVISVTAFDDGGTPVLVARSDQPFPMAVGASPMLRDDSPWVANRGQLTLVCVNRPHPVLLAARLPADQLIGMAAQLARFANGEQR